MSPPIILHQFQFSHFNEKARWALDYKALAHERRSYLPGPHVPKIKRLSGQNQTPVLQIGDEVIAGSGRIIEELEERFPEPHLYPVGEVERLGAADVLSYFDEVVGPKVRLALFSVAIDEGAYMCGMFSKGKPLAVRALYRLTYPLAKPLIRKGNGITGQAAIDDAFAATDKALTFIEENLGPEGYLAGSSFSVADLTAAALLAPITNPPHPDMARPEPMPKTIAALLAQWRDRPAIEWVLEMYRRHRPDRAQQAA
jgi:glutathione S-transferase